MSNTLVTAFYGTEEIRITIIDEQVWMALVDVCKNIGIKNSRNVYKRLDEDEKAVVHFVDTSSNGVTQKREIQFINEFGLYHVLLTARSEEAKPFRRWVTHDVLPRIFKYGYYKLTTDERRFAAYKSIAKSLGLSDIGQLEDKYARMSLKALEAFDNDLKTEEERKVAEEKKKAEEEAVREVWCENYPYSYEEIDKLCDGDVEFLKTFIPVGEEDKYYKSTTGSVYSERFSEKFKKKQFRKSRRRHIAVLKNKSCNPRKCVVT